MADTIVAQPATPTPAPAPASAKTPIWKTANGQKWILIIVALGIIALAIYLRAGLLNSQGLFEPDGFFYYTAIKQAVAHNFIETNPVLLSGYPTHNSLNEAPALIYMTLIPYAILQYFGVSLLDTMRLVPIFFGVVDVILAYFLVKYLSNSRLLGLLAMVFVAASSGNIARTAGTVYRGDSFITAFILLALIFTLKVIKEERFNRKVIYAAITGVIISFGNLAWNGGSVVLAFVLVALVMYIIYALLSASKKHLVNSFFLIGAALLGYLLVVAYTAAGFILNSLIPSATFFLVFAAMLVLTLIGYFLVTRVSLLSGSLSKRLAVLIVGGAAAMAILFIAFPAPLINLLATGGGGGLISPGGSAADINVGRTTQELQPPTFAFLWASFGLELFFAPVGVLLFLLFAQRTGSTPYLRKGAIGFNVTAGFVVILSYLLLAAWLQNGAIRYNSILSVPLALFSAYAVYLGFKFFEGWNINITKTPMPVNAIFSGLVVALLLLQLGFVQAQSFGSGQADGINPQFLQAMQWLSNNTASNAKVLALWPDGSVVEAIGNRQSYMDSVGGENNTRTYWFGQWLFNTTPDTQYLTTDGPSGAWHPNYIVARYFWYDELAGIAIEANITSNLSRYGFDQLNSVTLQRNASTTVYQFSSPAYVAQLRISQGPNGQSNAVATLGQAGSSQLAQIRNVVFLNTSNLAYSVVHGPANTLNYSLLLTYSGQNITGAQILGPLLPNTNMFKMLDECSYSQCALSTPNVTATLVYANPDTKIIKLSYH